MIFIDSNIPLYLIAAPHRHKSDAQRLLEKLLSERERLVTDTELGSPQLSARDALHLAVMEQHDIARILSFDSGFDGFPGVTRLS